MNISNLALNVWNLQTKLRIVSVKMLIGKEESVNHLEPINVSDSQHEIQRKRGDIPGSNGHVCKQSVAAHAYKNRVKSITDYSRRAAAVWPRHF